MCDRYANSAQVMASGCAAVANVEDLLNLGEDDFEGFEDIVDNSGDAGDISIVSTGTDEADNHFDAVIGALEDLIMEADFNSLQSGFFRTHCSIFEDSEENKLEYTSLFQSYIDLVETYIERRLKEVFPGFEMDSFMQQLQQHEQEMEGSDVLEVLLSFGDFSTFKDIMLSYKTEIAGSAFHVDVRSSVLHIPQMGLGGGMDESFDDPGTFDDDDYEEQGDFDDGKDLESRPAPDLAGLLSVSPLSLQGKGKGAAAFQELSVTGRHL